MVWRSLMEHVQPKDEIRNKRLQVFCDDIHKYKTKNTFNEHNSNVTVPEELQLWHRHNNIKQQVVEIEDQVMQAHQKLKQLIDKISTKKCQRDLSRRRLQDLQRRVWLLQLVSDELQTKKNNLQETRSIADSLCNTTNDDSDMMNKFDKCLSLLRKVKGQYPSAGSISLLSGPNPVACSSVVSTSCEDAVDAEEQLSSLMRCRSEALWAQLAERREALTAALASANGIPPARAPRLSPQTVLSHTMALQCTLGLEAKKNHIHIKQFTKKFLSAINHPNELPSEEACELLVLRCERGGAEARVRALRLLLEDVTSRAAPFDARASTAPPCASAAHVLAVDKAIKSKKSELKNLLTSLCFTERKILNVRDCLVSMFNSFHEDLPHGNMYHDLQLDIPHDSITTLRQFYEERQEKRKNKIELSIDLDFSGASIAETLDNNNMRYTDELRIYLKKFNLEKNRKLVLESGEKIWIFESLQSSLDHLYTKWLDIDVSCSLLSPCVSLSKNLQRLHCDIQIIEALEMLAIKLDKTKQIDTVIDINSKSEEEKGKVDRIKKRLNNGLLSLQKTDKVLDVANENLELWSKNTFPKYISSTRTVEGKSFRYYEALYLENLNI